jgi:hypothetical protein
MTNRGLLIFAVGLALLAGGLFALNFPVFLDSFDQYGVQLKCGTGYTSDLTQASIADTTGRATNYVDECYGALAFRRAWTITLAVIGWAILAWLLVAFWRHSQLVSEE